MQLTYFITIKRVQNILALMNWDMCCIIPVNARLMRNMFPL